jgi:diguanylate cyclase (GGDEF)-like protein
VHPNTVRTWTQQGRLPCLRINPRGDRRYRVDDLRRFLSAARTEAAPAGRREPHRWTATDGVVSIPVHRSMAPDAVPHEADLAFAAELLARAGSRKHFAGALDETVRLLHDRLGYQVVVAAALEGDALVPRSWAGVVGSRPDSLPVDGAIAALLTSATPGFTTPDPTHRRLLSIDHPGSIELIAPIRSDGVTWGALIVLDSRPWAIGDADPDLLAAATAQLGAICRTEALAQRIEAQSTHAAALRRIGADITSQLDLPFILSGLVDHAMVLFGADRAAVFERHTDDSWVTNAQRNLSENYLRFVSRFPAPSLGAEAIARRRAVFAVDYPNDPRGQAVRPAVVQEGFDTLAMAPLLADGAVVGLLGIYHDQRHPWSADELDLLDGLAVQASAAIGNARTYARLASWASQLQSLQRLGARLSGLRTVRDIGNAIAAELSELIDFGNIRVYRREGDELRPVAWRNRDGLYEPEAEEQLRSSVDRGITGWVARHGLAQYLPDAAADPRTATLPGTAADEEESMMLAPLMHEDHVLGVVSLSKVGLDRFSTDDLRLLEIYASFAGQALANAQASEAMQTQSAALERQLRSLRELQRISESILASLDVPVILEGIADRLGSLLDFDTLSIEMYDRVAGVLRPLTARGLHADLFLEPWEPGETGLAPWVVEHGIPQLVTSEFADSRVNLLRHDGVDASLMVIPLTGHQHVAGVLSIERIGTERPFDEEEFELVRLFAAQASIAIQNAEAHEAVAVQARTDALTGLKHHGTFRQALERTVRRDEPFSLLMVDLDDFKAYNDRYGHPAGDVLLRTIATGLIAAGRDTDEVFRYGGDEFALLLPGATPEGAMAVALKVGAAVRAATGIAPDAPERRRRASDAAERVRAGRPPLLDVAITASIGIATYPQDAHDEASLLLAADRACYAAKSRGRDHVATADEGLALAGDLDVPPPTPFDPAPSLSPPGPSA